MAALCRLLLKEFMEKEFKPEVGSEVQSFEYDESFHSTLQDGVVLDITPAEKEKPYYPGTKEVDWHACRHLSKEDMDKTITFATVKWANGTESKVDVEDLQPRDSQFEREFRLALSPNQDKIAEKLREASAALAEAVQLAEDSGTPFTTHISFVRNEYVPKSVKEKFPNVTAEKLQEISQIGSDYHYDDGYYCWKHSAVC